MTWLTWTREDLEKLGLPMDPRKRFFRAIASAQVSLPERPKNAELSVVQDLGSDAKRRQLTILF